MRIVENEVSGLCGHLYMRSKLPTCAPPVGSGKAPILNPPATSTASLGLKIDAVGSTAGDLFSPFFCADADQLAHLRLEMRGHDGIVAQHAICALASIRYRLFVNGPSHD